MSTKINLAPKERKEGLPLSLFVKIGLWAYCYPCGRHFVKILIFKLGLPVTGGIAPWPPKQVIIVCCN